MNYGLLGGQGQLAVGQSSSILEVVNRRVQVRPAQSFISGQAFFDFPNIPPWAKKISVFFNQFSTNGVAPFGIQLGYNGVITAGVTYSGLGITLSTGAGIANSWNSFAAIGGATSAANNFHGRVEINLFDQFNNISPGNSLYEIDGRLSGVVSQVTQIGSGVVIVPYENIDRVRIMTSVADLIDLGNFAAVIEGW